MENPFEQTQSASLDLIGLESFHVRRFDVDGEWLYCLDDVIEFFKEDRSFFGQWLDWMNSREERKIIKGMIKEVLVDGKRLRMLSAVGVFRLVQGLRGRKAEQLKTWLSTIAFERATEQINPSQAVDRAIRTWYARGYDDVWIMERIKGLRVRRSFTDEMKRHVNDDKEYGLLTAIVHQGTFGITIKQHYELKGIEVGKQELREDMSTTELILIALGEHTSTLLAKANRDSGIEHAKDACRRGGRVAGAARAQIEEELNQSVVTSERTSQSYQPQLPAKDDKR